ncbi:hypothetical protein L7F22_018311 [Adiantum nelumboides]|nr:hypothetical protein [Adiantum nelumboides]
MVVSKYSFALSEYNKAFKKLKLLQADVHQNEGANLLVEKLRGQLKDAEAALLKAQGSGDAVNAMKVKQVKNTIDRLSLTLQTLQVVVEEKAPLDAMDSALKERDFTQEVEECAQARMDFVKTMQVKRSIVLLSAPSSKVPPVGTGTLPLDKVCSACGLTMYDDDALGMFWLPCNHAFHMYCFGHLVASKETCMKMGCMQPILHTMRSSVILSSGVAGGNKCEEQNSKMLVHDEKEDVLHKGGACEDMEIIIGKSKPPQEDGDASMDTGGNASCVAGAVCAGGVEYVRHNDGMESRQREDGGGAGGPTGYVRNDDGMVSCPWEDPGNILFESMPALLMVSY